MTVNVLHVSIHLILTTATEISSTQTQLTLRCKQTLNIIISIPNTTNHFTVLYTDNIYDPRQLTLLFVIIIKYISTHVHCLTFLPYNNNSSTSRTLFISKTL